MIFHSFVRMPGALPFSMSPFPNRKSITSSKPCLTLYKNPGALPVAASPGSVSALKKAVILSIAPGIVGSQDVMRFIPSVIKVPIASVTAAILSGIPLKKALNFSPKDSLKAFQLFFNSGFIFANFFLNSSIALLTRLNAPVLLIDSLMFSQSFGSVIISAGASIRPKNFLILSPAVFAHSPIGSRKPFIASKAPSRLPGVLSHSSKLAIASPTAAPTERMAFINGEARVRI